MPIRGSPAYKEKLQKDGAGDRGRHSLWSASRPPLPEQRISTCSSSAASSCTKKISEMKTGEGKTISRELPAV